MKSEEWEGSFVCLCRRQQGDLSCAAGGAMLVQESLTLPGELPARRRRRGGAVRVGGPGGPWGAEKLSVGGTGAMETLCPDSRGALRPFSSVHMEDIFSSVSQTELFLLTPSYSSSSVLPNSVDGTVVRPVT